MTSTERVRRWKADNRARVNEQEQKRYWADPARSRARCRARMQTWYLKHRDEAIERVAQWRKANPEYARKYMSIYRPIWVASNLEKCRAYSSNYRKRWPDRHTARQSRCRAIKLGSVVKGTEEAIKAIYTRASELRKWFYVAVDHIVPLSKGGTHSPDNLQIIYQFENAAKHARLDYKPKVIFT